MKFSTTILSLSALSSANAFMVQTPKYSMQPLAAKQQIQRSNELTGEGQMWTDTSIDQGVAGSLARAGAPQAPPAPEMAKYDAPRATNEIFDDIDPVTVQGGSLRTCSFEENVDRVSVFLKSTGRPLNANVELWQGPDNAPQKMSVYLEDGDLRPFRATIESPGGSNAVAIRNTGQMEFPLSAYLECVMSGSTKPSELLFANSEFRTVQGGAVYTRPFPPSVQSVQIALRSDGRPLNSRIELLQGPNNNKQVMEVYTEDGQQRPFYAIIDTPGSGNVVRIVNSATVEFPLTASVESYIVDDSVVDQSYSKDGGMMWS